MFTDCESLLAESTSYTLNIRREVGTKKIYLYFLLRLSDELPVFDKSGIPVHSVHKERVIREARLHRLSTNFSRW